MTTLVAWFAADGRGASSIYLASDSRVTWTRGSGRWDAARKLFACRRSPDIFGYCGDVLFPSQALGQITELADEGLLFNAGATAASRHASVLAAIDGSLGFGRSAPINAFTLVHVARDASGLSSAFKVWTTSVGKRGVGADTLCSEMSGPAAGSSRRLLALGSGANGYVEEAIRWSASAQANTSRGCFTALYDVLARGEDDKSGGAPQLAGLYRVGNGRAFGIVHDGQRYFNGQPVPQLRDYCAVEWRDETFQRINGNTLALVHRAQRQVRPKIPR